MWIVLAIAAAAAGGQGAGMPGHADLQRMFALMDRDRDGFVTANEQPRVTRTRAEGPNRVEIRPSRSWIASYDFDGDGRVSRREFVGRAAAEISTYTASARRN
jgi:Ca2+-binding EF-hand superfamily protein